jgi:hypothetical protein
MEQTFDHMTNEDLQKQVRMFDNNLRAMKSEQSHLTHENSKFPNSRPTDRPYQREPRKDQAKQTTPLPNLQRS